MKKRVLLMAIYCSFMVLWFSSCDKTPTATDEVAAKEKSAQAYTEMENLFAASGSIQDKDFTNVEKLYKEAVAADPNNPTANFGAAFTHILATFADTAIKNAVNRWEDNPAGSTQSLLQFGIPTGTSEMSIPTKVLGSNLVKIIKTATSDPPTIAEMQNLLRDRFLPRIDYAIARLAAVEQHQDFEMRISGKMQGDASKKDVYLDLTEVFIMDAMLHGMKAVVEQFLVFKFELNDYTTKSIVAALQQNNPNFFVLAPDGSTRAQNVKSSLHAAVGKIRGGVNFLKSETDDQNDDIIKRGSEGIAVHDLDTVLTYLDRIETALNGTFSIEFNDADSDNNDYTIQVSLNNFFNNLPQNPKQSWLPAYTIDTTSSGAILWRWQGQDYASFTFPDPTFSGLLPGMTNETLKRILYIDEAFAWRVSVDLYNVNGMSDNAGLTVVINEKTYIPKQIRYYAPGSYYRYFEFYIMDNNGMQVQQLIATVNGEQIPLQFHTGAPVVKLKEYEYIDADVTLSSQNSSAEYISNYVILNLQTWGYYRIERAVGAGSFVLIDSTQMGYYYDYNISAGTTYKYRALRIPNYYYSGWPGYYYAYRPNNYTNTVSITIP